MLKMLCLAGELGIFLGHSSCRVEIAADGKIVLIRIDNSSQLSVATPKLSQLAGVGCDIGLAHLCLDALELLECRPRRRKLFIRHNVPQCSHTMRTCVDSVQWMLTGII